MIAIVDYGAGNITSVERALRACGADCRVTNHPDDLQHAAKIVLPGVGNFAATEELARSGLRDAILAQVAKGVPFLGICVGMQWMLEGSREAPGVSGAGWMAGQCQRFPQETKCPHVGWNQLEQVRESRLLAQVPAGAFVYFTHSYFVPRSADDIASTEYEGNFASAMERGNIFGVQFHPEKSGAIGLRILENFLAI